MNKQILILIISVFTTAYAFSNTTEPTIIANGQKSFTIDSKIWKSETVNVSISDRYGVNLYYDVQDTKKTIQYSLENLPAGDYQVTISNEFKTITNEISITSNELTVDPNAETTYKPLIKVSEESIDINFLPKGSNTTITIISNEAVIFTDRNDDTFAINKRFNISKLKAGEYTFLVENGKDQYIKNFIK